MSRIYRATVRCHHGDGTLAQPSLHYQTDLDITESEPNPSDVAGEIWAKIGTRFLACCHAETAIDELVVSEEVLAPNIGVSGVHAIGGVGTGLAAAVSIPTGLVAVINLHTNVRSRSARGWFHPPGPMQASAVNGDQWAAGYQGYLDLLVPLLDDQLDIGFPNASQINPVVYSRTRHQRGQAPYTFRVTSATVNHVPHWLKSRMTSP